jgi:hypothetical protein
MATDFLRPPLRNDREADLSRRGGGGGGAPPAPQAEELARRRGPAHDGSKMVPWDRSRAWA